MKIDFNKIHIHHFLSIDDATIDLRDRGYCLVIGINKNPKDAAKSNGSGKSSIWNAISYALVGETLGGLKSNLPNLYYDDGCYVELEFDVDASHYKIIRSKDDDTYGTNLKIYINDEDKSGKGVRESQALLDQYLPDLTIELLGSVVILGQGLPQKFTSNSPSGRKEVLEHLSKSDFMIQDLKSRLEARQTELSNSLRKIDDTILSFNSKLSVLRDQLKISEDKLASLSVDVNYDKLISEAESTKKTLKEQLDTINESYKILTEERNTLTTKINSEAQLKSDRISKVYSQYTEYDNEIKKTFYDVNTQISRLESEIKSLKEIKDVCPTCGQKIPNVIKPDTSEKEKLLAKLLEDKKEIEQEIKDNEQGFLDAKQQINKLYEDAVQDANSRLTTTNSSISVAEADKKNIELRITTLDMNIISYTKDRDNHDKSIKEINDSIATLKESITEHENNITSNDESRKDVLKHVEAVNKMNTFIRRDFRGVLLKNVIDYINVKAKEYCSKIFNSNALDFVLDGNNLDIIFEGKDYENLSGGEKQRIDIIVQFAIRDMMSKYLGFSSNILVLDEITDALDSVSCDKVINFITDELKDVESVFIVSHHATELQLPTDSTIVIQKNELGVSEVK